MEEKEPLREYLRNRGFDAQDEEEAREKLDYILDDWKRRVVFNERMQQIAKERRERGSYIKGK